MISPSHGNIMGGVPITVTGPKFNENDQIKLLFDDIVVDCIYINNDRSLCISPFLFKTGKVTVSLNHNGTALETSTNYFSSK